MKQKMVNVSIRDRKTARASNCPAERLVLSGINLFEGGPLSIYYDCLDTLRNAGIYKKYQITAFVHKKELFRQYEDIALVVELPASRKNWLLRLYYEYFYFMKYSRQRNIAVWISLHDITPRVKVRSLYTYCHNPSPFLKKDVTKIKYSIRNTAFTFFYQYLYRINIRSAAALIVQQEWMRREFLRMFPVKNVIVARPDASISYRFQGLHASNRQKIFIYAAYPRYFKNFEVLFRACEMLERAGMREFQVWVTIDGSENAYSMELKKKYGSIKCIKWLGIQSRETLFELYDRADCMVFPSLMETWGLPISEFKQSGKDIILADLPYAHEALGSYEKCMFFQAENAVSLCRKMNRVLRGRPKYCPQHKKKIQEPVADSWEELFGLILEQ